MINSIAQWLREGGQDIAAEFIQQCEIDRHYVDTYSELATYRSYDLFDVSVSAPREVHLKIEQEYDVSDQIEAAIRGQAEGDGYYVRNISWIPSVTTPIAEKDRELEGILTSFDAEHVSRFWKKALARKANDPDGAITAARSMLESACKHVLTDKGVEFKPKAKLPNLFSNTLDALKLLPSQQTDEEIRKVMGNCQSIVSGLALIRNDIGDAHGKIAGENVADSVHAEFVVNLAASVAMLILGKYSKQQDNVTTTAAK